MCRLIGGGIDLRLEFGESFVWENQVLEEQGSHPILENKKKIRQILIS